MQPSIQELPGMSAQTIAHPYFGESLLRLGVALRPFFEPLVLSVVPRGELSPLSVADIFSVHPDAMTGTIRSIGEPQPATEAYMYVYILCMGMRGF